MWLEEWIKRQQVPLHNSGDINVHRDWSYESDDAKTPLSPLSNMGVDTKQAQPEDCISAPLSSPFLSTHPLLDARRTFPTAVVFATRFVGTAWANLDGLTGSEVGGC